MWEISQSLPDNGFYLPHLPMRYQQENEQSYKYILSRDEKKKKKKEHMKKIGVNGQ